jgi:hypothetical protein
MRLTESEYQYLLAMSGQALPPETREQQFQARIVRVAKDLGYLAYHTLNSRGSTAGFPDLVMVDPRPCGTRPGGDLPLFMCELKTARGKLTHAQEIWLRALHGKTVVADVWRPGGLGEVVAKLRGQG